MYCEVQRWVWWAALTLAGEIKSSWTSRRHALLVVPHSVSAEVQCYWVVAAALNVRCYAVAGLLLYSQRHSG
jgi:hypothetical protein